MFRCMMQDMMSKDNAVVSSSVNNPLTEVVELLVEMANREVTEQKRPWCHYGHFRVGPHVLTFPAIEDEWKLIGYIINEHLDGRYDKGWYSFHNNYLVIGNEMLTGYE